MDPTSTVLCLGDNSIVCCPRDSSTVSCLGENRGVLCPKALSNCRWLHNTALKYVNSVQLGAYMWRNGLKRENRLQEGGIVLFEHDERSSHSLEKGIFDPFLTQIFSKE